MDIDTLLRDEFCFGCGCDTPCAGYSLDHGTCAAHGHQRYSNDRANTAENRRAAATRLTVTRASTPSGKPASKVWPQLFRTHLGRYGRYRQRYPPRA